MEPWEEPHVRVVDKVKMPFDANKKSSDHIYSLHFETCHSNVSLQTILIGALSL